MKPKQLYLFSSCTWTGKVTKYWYKVVFKIVTKNCCNLLSLCNFKMVQWINCFFSKLSSFFFFLSCTVFYLPYILVRCTVCAAAGTQLSTADAAVSDWVCLAAAGQAGLQQGGEALLCQQLARVLQDSGGGKEVASRIEESTAGLWSNAPAADSATIR